MNPTLAISVRQPWAWAIAHAGKDVENRVQSRPWLQFFELCTVRGVPARVFLHAAKNCTAAEYDDAESGMYDAGLIGPLETRYDDDDRALPELWIPDLEDLPRGGIIGIVTITAVVPLERTRPSRWAFGPWCLQLADFQELPFTPCSGALGLWKVPPPASAAALLGAP